MTKAETLKQQEKKAGNDLNFEKDLSIDKYKLDAECLSHSVTYFRYADACQQAKALVSKSDDNLKLVYAERNISIRKEYADQGIKFTEAVITAELEKDSNVKEAKEELRNAQSTYSRLLVAVQAMETKKSELDNLVKLYCAGYFSTPSASDDVRKNINEQTSIDVRKKLNK